MKLTSGTITVPVERDGQPVGELCFDPGDVAFAERFYRMTQGLTQREQQLRQQQDTPLGERLTQLTETVHWLRAQLDEIFGEGSSVMLFGEQCSLTLFQQFFEGIEPVIRRARDKKTARYRGVGGDVMA
ncbi:MAG: hypothetical protein RR276_07740 [Angelakisella sp.]